MAKWYIMLYTALVWWCYFTNSPATSFSNETDRLALIAFKAAIDQDPFGAMNSWNDTSHYCVWKGILCSRRHRQRVVSLNLMSQGLVGSLSPHIGNLSFLKNITLSNNSFYGAIPQELGRLFRIHRIKLQNNSFDGKIPDNLSNCSNLIHLTLNHNNLSGRIPPELGSLSNLEVLGLSINQLSGSIPPSLGNMSSLSLFSLGTTDLQGEIPKEISQLRSLTIIQFSENHLTGKIPSSLYNISTIEFFGMGSNQLQGSIPPDLGSKLPNLKYLDYGENQFTGLIPTSLSNASELEDINFSMNDFTGPVPEDFGRIRRLRIMLLSYNRLQDDCSFISLLTNCSRLQGIEVANNLLSGTLPHSIANLSTHINYIVLEYNQLRGSIPPAIGNLVDLTVLIMSANYLTCSIPDGIGKLQNLQLLYLGMNTFTGELPSSLGNLTLLNVLDLGQNNIYGNIPPSLSNCRSLLKLNLSHNSLNGSIPPEIMILSSISIFLGLAHNALTGSLPRQVGSLINLAELDVSNNRLSGYISESLSSCVVLQLLHLEGNLFGGEIPKGLSALRGLQELDLSRNNLSGHIPSFVGELRLLEKLNLSFNGLYGEVPIQGVFGNASAISIVGNYDLCGGIADLNLPPCPSSKSNKHKSSHRVKVIIIVVIAAVMCLILLLFFFIIFHWQRTSSKKDTSTPSSEHQFLRVSYAELHKSTNGFSEANLIGVGGFGSVYKGILNQGHRAVAVKVLNLQLEGASKSFLSECKALRTIRHRNLLKILSVCSSVDFQGNDFRALVYEFMANGSLEKWLHPDVVGEDEQQEESCNLKLIQRLDIAIDIASVLVYLHSGCESTIVHGDLKPSNILLDDEMIAHVGDFGLAKIISTISSELAQRQSNSIAVNGTIGYVAPEYGVGGMVSTQRDVYSYGILLLEIFTGKRPTDDAFKDDSSLHNFVKSALPDQVMEIVDPCILVEHDIKSRIKDCMISIFRIGVACSIESPSDRMEMGVVVNELCKIKDVYTKG